MATVGKMCGGVCVFLTGLFLISTAFSIDDYHFYQNDPPHLKDEHQLDVQFLDGPSHSLNKRDLSQQLTQRQTQTQKSPLQKQPENGSSASESPPTTQTTPTAPPNPGLVNQKTIITQPLDKPMRNLGENGTGIRLNITQPTPRLPQDIITPTSLFDDDIIDSTTKSFNETLRSHNITVSKTDPNLYYNKTVFNDQKTGQFYWIDMSNRTDVKVNPLLSDSHRRAATVTLSFEFPFYGHLIKNVTIATGGFLYTGDYVHSWLAATQYIAPLMANFDTSLSNDSFIKYLDNGTAFTVEWERAALQDRPKDGEFTFQVTLFKNGDIVFVYKQLPLLIDQIREQHHPVKVGLSDAYIMDHTVFLVRRKTIYEYDRFHMNKSEIRNWTAIYLKALPTCHDFHDCTSCLSTNITTECRWCPSFNKCSVGFDRNRQDWLAMGCSKQNLSNASMCSAAKEATVVSPSTVYNELPDSEQDDAQPERYAGPQVMYPVKGEDIGVSSVIAILFLVGLLVGISFWVVYAYRNPHTTSGQMLIRYRPSQWRWRRGEARYTAATIHM